jgi:ubiquinone/menaquinone biosynthesis C-methylase UbiE
MNIARKKKKKVPKSMEYKKSEKPKITRYSSVTQLLRDQPKYWKIIYKLSERLSPRTKNTLLESADDEEFYVRLKEHLLPATDDTKADERRGRRRIRDIERLLRTSRIRIDADENTKLLDFGAGRGIISDMIGEALGVQEQNIYKVDIEQWAEQEDRPESKNYILIAENEPLPFPDNSFEVILCFQVLHHIKKYRPVLKEFKRILEPGGLVIFREHDLAETQKKAIDLEHMMYLLLELPSYNEAKEKYDELYSRYRSSDEWEKTLKRYGFVPRGKMYQSGFNTGYYYQIFQIEK